MNVPGQGTQIVYWHRQLPPPAAELVAEHTVEANSGRITGTLYHDDELWSHCYRQLMASAEDRLIQEVRRLGGRYAHVYDESIVPKKDDAAGQSWLHGTFKYTLYRAPAAERSSAGAPK